jgi:hypothetical protein
MTDFHEMSYDHHATRGNPTYVLPILHVTNNINLATLHSAEVGRTLNFS